MKAGIRRTSMINMDNSLATFSESFYRLFNHLNEDAEESLVSLLEEKVIPKQNKETGKEAYKRPKTLLVDRNVEHRRSFHRKRRDVNEDSQFLRTYDYQESLHSPSVTRRRSSSIAVPQPTQDLLYSQLQIEKPNRAPSPKSFVSKKSSPGLITNSVTPQRNRTCSMPVNTRQQKPMLSQTKRQEDPDGYYRVRSFSITPSGVCKNLGDCLKTRRSRSSCSVDSSPANLLANQRLSGTNSVESNNEVPAFTVGMLGASNVGKTTLSYQFTTSEYICAYDTSLDDDYGQKTVCISLNGQEAEFKIIDIPAHEMSVETFCYTWNVDVFVVVYSIIDAQSFKVAEDTLLYLWKNDYMSSKGVILVGNKADLERRREIPASTGKKLALSWHCKFIETSSGLDHNVDELLVGIFAQVQLNPKRSRSQMSKSGLMGSKKQLFKSILNFGKKAKSCENLFVL